MIPAWSVSVILLGCVFGKPVPSNRTQNDTRKYENETSLQLNTTDNSTEMTARDNMTSLLSLIQFGIPYRSMCILSTCLITNLVSSMQSGSEKAGSASTDPYGNGKK